MSRLIDADVLIEAIRNHCENVYCEVVALNDFYRLAHEHVIEVVNIQPTAYDVEKVVAELEEERERNLNGWKDATNIFALTKYGHGLSAYVKAINIVKRGGIQ